MATTVVMPKQGQSVESCILVEWKKRVGDSVAVDDPLCEVETDKTTMEVPAPVAGIVLAQLYAEGDEVPVMTPLAIIGAPGEVLPERAEDKKAGKQEDRKTSAPESIVSAPPTLPTVNAMPATPAPASPRARHLAERKQVALTMLTGSGPEGRIIERDVAAAMTAQPKVTPLAKVMVAEGGYQLPAQGSGPSGWITTKDLQALSPDDELRMTNDEAFSPEYLDLAPSAQHATRNTQHVSFTTIPLKGIRKTIADRMLASLQTTAQLTLNTSADARALRTYRERLKQSPEAWGLRNVSINDLLLFALARVLPQHPALNALFTGDAIVQHQPVHLGFAVDTPRGLLVPVIQHADQLPLKQLAAESKRLATACQEGKISVAELNGGTFTLSNLGAFGIEHFTPVLNPPQVAILGVGAIAPKAVETADGVAHLPHISLSLTINHQVVDGAPAARFLQALTQAIAQIDLLLAG